MEALILMATKAGPGIICGKMASDSAKEIAKAVNSFDYYSSEDQQSLLTVIEDYFTTQMIKMRMYWKKMMDVIVIKCISIVIIRLFILV